MNEGLRQCTKCGEWKPWHRDFFRWAKKGDVYYMRHACSDCERARCRAYQLARRDQWMTDYWKNRDRQLGYMRRWRETHREYDKARRSKYLPQARLHYREKHDADPDSFNIAARRRYYANLDQSRRRNRMHQARRRAKPGGGTPFTLADVDAQYARQRGRCFDPNCGASLGTTYHVDHLIPLNGEERCGDNSSENIVLLCPTCNMSKSNKDPMDVFGILF